MMTKKVLVQDYERQASKIDTDLHVRVRKFP